jgi:hypothetical protein
MSLSGRSLVSSLFSLGGLLVSLRAGQQNASDPLLLLLLVLVFLLLEEH